jgi:UDP:flavonoid glycosyltransferase YjiC (YdhE family)
MTTRQPAGMAAAPSSAATAEHAQGSDQREPRLKILVAGWDSGGGVEAVHTVVRRAVARGHQVRVLGTAGLRDRFEPAGAAFRVYRYAPDNDMRRPETDLVKEWEARTPLGAFARVRDRVMFGPARLFCRDIVEELDREPADVVAVDTLIPSALSGAEAAGVPAVLLMHGPYALPRPGAPLIGTGFLPPRGRPGRLRDRAAGSLAMRLFRTGLPALNRARAELGLASVRDLGELAASASRVRVCTSPGYDFAADAVPGNVSYVGAQLEDGGAARDDPRPGADDRPLVLVSFSSTVMHQEALLQKAADALGRLPVRALVTTGPAVDPAVIQAPPNVSVRRRACHADGPPPRRTRTGTSPHPIRCRWPPGHCRRFQPPWKSPPTRSPARRSRTPSGTATPRRARCSCPPTTPACTWTYATTAPRSRPTPSRRSAWPACATGPLNPAASCGPGSHFSRR